MAGGESETLGPISYLVVEFPGSKMTGEGLPILVDLVDQGVIRILDLVFVAKGQDGSLGIIGLADLDHDGTIDLAVFEGVSSGLVSQEDLAEAAPVIAPGSSAAILIFENRWATPFIHALRRGEAQLVAAGYIPQTDLVCRARRGRRLKGADHAASPRYRTHRRHRRHGHCRLEPRLAPPAKSLGPTGRPAVRPTTTAVRATRSTLPLRPRRRRGTRSHSSKISRISSRRGSSPRPSSRPRRRRSWQAPKWGAQGDPPAAMTLLTSSAAVGTCGLRSPSP